MSSYHDDGCTVICENNNRTSDAEILDFQDKRFLSVSLNRSVKLVMRWTGTVYEGKMAGLTFHSAGPKIREAMVRSR